MRAIFPAVWLSPRGVWVLLGLALCLALASVVAPLLYAFGAAAAIGLALLIADAALGPPAALLRIARAPLESLVLGRPAQATYVVENRAGMDIRLAVFETPLDAIAFEVDGLRAQLAARSRASLPLDFVPLERGHVHFGALYVWVENRIGLLRRRYRVEAADDTRVLPDLSAVSEYGTLAKRRTLLAAGLRRLRMRGVGNEFESLREYQPGDAFRQVDWKATARRGRMMTAQYEVERSQNVIVALDCGRLMTPRVPAQPDRDSAPTAAPSGDGKLKFDYALTAALSIARVAQTAGDNVGFIAFAARPLIEIAPRRGAAHFDALVRATFYLQPRLEEPDYQTVFTGLRDRYGKRSLIILLTDIFDPVASAAVLAGLAALVPRHLVMCVLMNDAALARALDEAPLDASGAYRTAVAMLLADERAKAVAVLRARGIIVVDVPAPELTVALLDAYLDVKSRGLL